TSAGSTPAGGGAGPGTPRPSARQPSRCGWPWCRPSPTARRPPRSRRAWRSCRPPGRGCGWPSGWSARRAPGPRPRGWPSRAYLPRGRVAADFEEGPLRRFTWLSFLASSAAFGALHGHWLAGTLAGMLYALAVYCRGRLADAVVAHATTNALLAAYVLAT